MAVALVAALTTSCSSEDYFDQDAYDNLITQTFPVENVAANHNWNIISTANVNVTLTQSGDGNSTISIYDSDPDSEGAYLLAKKSLANGEKMTTSVNYKAATDSLYLAVTDADGTVNIYHRAIEDGKLTTTVGDLSEDGEGYSRTSTSSLPENLATLRYCFEGDYPQPGDYDFNDCVLDITPERVSTTEVKYNVSLAAVGYSYQIAAALHLEGIKYSSDIISVSVSGDLNTYSSSKFSYDLLNSEFGSANYIKGNGNDVVIYLFNDAHYAFTHNIQTSTGSVYRPYINTIRQSETSLECLSDQSPITMTITIDFTSSPAADDAMKQTMIDPFIVTEYNGGKWEIHTANWKTDPALFDSDNYQSYDINLPWALCLSGSFLYPKESTPIGSNKEGKLTGAYSIYGHSFGEWCEDMDTATDWYDYPATRKYYQ